MGTVIFYFTSCWKIQPIPVVSNLTGCQTICIPISLSSKTKVQTAICQYHRHRRQRRDADNVPRHMSFQRHGA